MSSKTTYYMKGHAQGRTTNGLMRHLVDSLSWKIFDSLNPTFALEHCNVRLGLACDGFNPFSNMSIAHNTWPVILIPYNLPPWMFMKQSFFMLSLLIPGPTGPRNDIDIYLQPLGTRVWVQVRDISKLRSGSVVDLRVVDILVVDVRLDMDELTSIRLSIIGTLVWLSHPTRPWIWA